ncbi:MAG: hypothetical protein MAG581_02295 [Deltaproteobacteria bacterium]|jgi:predicted metal-binding membrane protein|nr:hypothetical protein [Deltaproteobacteria bacterium]
MTDRDSGFLSLAKTESATLNLLVLVSLAGWIFLAWAALDMANPLAMLMMPMTSAWSAANVIAVFIMWSLMMMAMMLPSAAPMILLVANLNRKKGTKLHTLSFTGAYLVIWFFFSTAAVFVQWMLQHNGLMSAKMVSSSALLSGILLITVGVLQFSPLKSACLKHCRSPIGFLMTDWRKGTKGAWVMGFRHGAYCLGCCYALMLLLFVGGVMNLAWVAALTLAVAVEKIFPQGERVAQFLGGGLILAGLLKIVLN